MKKMEKTWQARGLCHLHHSTVHDCHQCCRSCKNKIDSQPSSHPQNSRAQGTPFTRPSPPSSPAWAVCADDRERTYSMRGPPLHCQQCHPDNFAPSHLSLPQNMAVETKVMKMWTIYFQTVLLEFLGKEGVFEYYKTKPLFLNIQCMYSVSFIPCCCTFMYM